MDNDTLSLLLRKPIIVSMLIFLYPRGKNGATITELRKVASGSVSKYVNILENLGLTYSRRVHTDKPLDARVIYLSAKGKKFVEYYKEFLEKCKEI